jgi:hypothetical protein
LQKARSAGLFKSVKGRGQSLVRSVDESNPFIAREEFLMNRIVQRNGAAPPWVELQCGKYLHQRRFFNLTHSVELETAVNTFRELLRQSWVRRAVRLLTMSNPPELLHKVTPGQVKALRDPDWVKKELSYHETAVAELNSVVRKYNGLAPYHFRRSYYSREVEIDRMYETSVEDIMRELRERLRDSSSVGHVGTFGDAGNTSGSWAHTGSAPSTDTVEDIPPAKWRLRDLIRKWFNDMASSWSKMSS